MAFSADLYLRALQFAARAHGGQKMLSGLPYVVHLSSVAMEVACALRAEPGHDEDLAIVCALLHDVVEDTPTTLAEVETAFGSRAMAGVRALTRDSSLPEELQIRDSLTRIVEQGSEISIVKLADRITNTAATPPGWAPERIRGYREEAAQILEALGHASPFLAGRLRRRINTFGD